MTAHTLTFMSKLIVTILRLSRYLELSKGVLNFGLWAKIKILKNLSLEILTFEAAYLMGPNQILEFEGKKPCPLELPVVL